MLRALVKCFAIFFFFQVWFGLVWYRCHRHGSSQLVFPSTPYPLHNLYSLQSLARWPFMIFHFIFAYCLSWFFVTGFSISNFPCMCGCVSVWGFPSLNNKHSFAFAASEERERGCVCVYVTYLWMWNKSLTQIEKLFQYMYSMSSIASVLSIYVYSKDRFNIAI